MLKIDNDKIWKMVKQNHKKLNSCECHNFIDISPDKSLGKKYKCKNCSGILDSINVSWYNLGLKHGKDGCNAKNT